MARARAQAEPEPEQLTGEQVQVILCLLAGDNQRQAAEKCGVAAETISRWLNHDATFVAELNRERFALFQAHREHLRNLAGEALGVVSDIMHKAEDDRVRLAAALAVLKAAGLGELQPVTEAQTTRNQVLNAKALSWEFNM